MIATTGESPAVPRPTRTLQLTEARVKTLVAPPETRIEIRDAIVSGLILRVSTRAGQTTRAWALYRRVQGRPKRLSLGRWPDRTVADARDAARKMLGQVVDGKNPAAEKRAERQLSLTLKQALEAYLQGRRHRLRDSTVEDYQQDVRLTFPDWLDRRLVDLTPDMVAARHKRRLKDSPAGADRAMRVLRAVWNHAREIAPGLPENPVRRLTATRAWSRVGRRTRVVPRQRLGDFLQAVLEEESDTMRDYFLTLLLTGLRRNEAARLTWQEVDLKAATIRLGAKRVKAGRDHALPVPAALLERFEERRAAQTALQTQDPEYPALYVFPGPDPSKPLHNPYKAIARISERCGVPFTTHDLRRTFASMAESIGVTGYLLKRLMNHSTANDVTGGYVQLDMDTLRLAMERIAAAVSATLDVQGAREGPREGADQQSGLAADTAPPSEHPGTGSSGAPLGP